MNITIAAVMSLNGKITRVTDTLESSWASKEDGIELKKLLAKNSAYIMGSATFKVVKPKSKKEKLQVIMTRKVETYSNLTIPGQMEFTDAQPVDIIRSLEQRGHENVLVLGGSQIYGLFLDAGLITDAYLTVEPLLFGEGTELLAGLHRQLSCRLVNVKTLNDQGTISLHYLLGSKANILRRL